MCNVVHQQRIITLRLVVLLSIGITVITAQGQATSNFADSIRLKYNIPELAFAVISADSILEMGSLGVQRVHTDFKAKSDDRFHIGSNTKAVTAFVAALLVEQEKITWNTKFLKLFPELIPTCKRVYYNITLQDLLTFRAKLPAYTYTFPQPTKEQVTGDNAQQRLKLAKYFLSRPPMQAQRGITPSNADYVLAGLMLERATGKSFKDLITDFGQSCGIDFGFDYPNMSDISQPWGHDANLEAVPPHYNYKLNWLLSAGNLNISLPDYIVFIKMFLKGIKGRATILTAQTCIKLLYDLPEFSFGWFNKIDERTNHHIAYNEGNAGAFITRVEIDKEAGLAFIIFTNAATERTTAGITALMAALAKRYDKNY